MKGMVSPATLFEEMGFNYIGPLDGHDLPTLVQTLRNMRDMEGPQFLHVKTRKGRGFLPAEADPIAITPSPSWKRASPTRSAIRRHRSSRASQWDRRRATIYRARSRASIATSSATGCVTWRRWMTA